MLDLCYEITNNKINNLMLVIYFYKKISDCLL